MARLRDGQHVGAGRYQGPGNRRRGLGRLRDGQDVGGRVVGSPSVQCGNAGEDAIGVGEWGQRLDHEGLCEEPIAELVRTADGAKRGVQDGDAIAEALRLLEAMRREEDRDAAPAEVVDRLVDLPGRGRVQAGGWLVEEEYLWVAEQCSGEGDPLAETLRQSGACVVATLGELHSAQRRIH